MKLQNVGGKSINGISKNKIWKYSLVGSADLTSIYKAKGGLMETLMIRIMHYQEI